MRILHIAYDYDSASASARLAAEQMAQGHQVYFYSKLGLHRFTGSVPRGWPVTRLATAALNRLDRLIARFCIKGHEAGFVSPSLVTWPLPRSVAAETWDRVHIHWIASGFCSLSAILKRVQGLKVIHLHDYWLLLGVIPYGYASVSLNRLGRIVQRSSRKRHLRAIEAYRPLVVSPSSRGAEIAQDLLGTTGVAAQVLINPLDGNFVAGRSKLESAASGKLNVLQIISGGDPLRKGADITAAALAALPRMVAQQINLHQVGAGVRAVYAINGAAVHAYPAVAPADMPALYLTADYTLVWSLEETFSQAAAESLACGTPILTHAGLPCARFCQLPPSLVAPSRSAADLAALLASAVQRGYGRTMTSQYRPELSLAL